MGVFNLNGFDWNCKIFCQNHNNGKIIVSLFVCYLGLNQFNNVVNLSGRMLDLIYFLFLNIGFCNDRWYFDSIPG